MIETIDNLVQLFSLGIATVIALIFALHTKARTWILLFLFIGLFLLGDVYWFLYLFFYDGASPVFYIAYFSWDAADLFLMILLLFIRQEKGLFNRTSSDRRLFILVIIFTLGMCVFYMTYGSYISNLVTAFLMTGLIWHSLDGLLRLRGEHESEGGRRYIYLVTLLFCFLEYGLWTSSCFWMGDTIANVYFWFDFLLSVTFLLFIPALRKAVNG